MSIYTWGVVVLAALGIAWFGWAIVAGGSLRQVEESTPLPMPRRKRGPMAEGYCPNCQEAGVYMNKDGTPNRRHHSVARCERLRAAWLTPEQVAALPTHTWPPSFVQTDEPQPPQTVTTWPPGLAGAGSAPAEYAVGRATGIADVVTDTERRG